MGAWIVFVGAGLGGMARYGLGSLVQPLTGASFPWGTLLVNVTGSLVLAFTYAFLDRTLAAPEWRLFIGVGICGGYTTFSTFSYESVRLLQEGELGRAAAYVLGSAALGILAVLVGLRFANTVVGRG
jgi:CrcB protein